MIGKILVVFVLTLILFVLVAFVYQNLPGESIELSLKENQTSKGGITSLNYGTTPVFAENLRFNHNNISYFIDSSCLSDREKLMKEAFNIFQEEMGFITFYELGNDQADILVSCSDKYINLGEDLFAAGEGGPSRIINTSQFKTIEKGKISLYKNHECEYPVVELHELGHVFGFDHISNKKSIMYNTSNCDQRITTDMIGIIKSLYSIEPLAEARISELSAVKKGRYLDFNITVLNEGLLEIENISLTILSEEKEIDKIYLGKMGIGYGRTLKVTNMQLPLRDTEKIDFILDLENQVREFDETNNIALMSV